MNMRNKKSIHNFLKKLNTITNNKDLTKEVTSELLKICEAKGTWICLINPATGKIDIRRFSYIENIDFHLQKEAEYINTIAIDYLTNGYETEDIFEYSNHSLTQ